MEFLLLKYFIPLLLTSLLWEDNYKASRIFQWVPEVICRNLFCFCCFCHIAWPQRMQKCWAYKVRGKVQSPHCFVDFHRQINVKKQQYLKICVVEFDKIWQNSCHYITLQSMKTWNLIKVEQRIFVTIKFHMIFMLKISKKLFVKLFWKNEDHLP